MTNSTEALRKALADAVGADLVHTDDDVLLSHSHDYWLLDLQRRCHGAVSQALPLAVVRPRNHDDVVSALRFASGHALPVVPYGGGSGVCGGARPSGAELVLDLSAMNSIVALNETALTVTVQAGMNGGKFEHELNRRGYSMGHFPQSLHLSSVGGWVATRASGQASTKYGSIENMVVALKAVLADGTTIDTKSVPRRSAGPDLRQLLIGSEGTLAVITEVTYKIHPSAQTEGGGYLFADFHQGMTAIRRIMREGWNPAVLRLYDESETKRHFPHSGKGCMLIVESEGPRPLIKVELAEIHAICQRAGAGSQGIKPYLQWRSKRFDIPNVEELARQKGVVFDTIEIAADWDRIDDLYDAVIAALRARPGVMAASAHSSHSYQQGTCLYFTFAVRKPNWLPLVALSFLSRGLVGFDSPADLPQVEERYNQCWSAVLSAVLDNGGTISHHHGIGKVRLPWVERELGQAGLEMLAAIKDALDPQGILNPGTLLPPR